MNTIELEQQLINRLDSHDQERIKIEQQLINNLDSYDQERIKRRRKEINRALKLHPKSPTAKRLNSWSDYQLHRLGPDDDDKLWRLSRQ